MVDNFVWYELCTSDLDAAQDFYGKVIGWTAAPFRDAGPNEYRILSMNEAGVAGLMPLPDGMTRPFWLTYVGVTDADAAAATAEGAGATIHRRMDIPDVGRIVLLSDPQGVGYAMIQGFSDRKSEAFDQSRAGHANWHELSTPDPAAAFVYYAGQHGWAKGRSMEMGAMGSYQIVQADGIDVGGMMPVHKGMQATWLAYFGSPDIDDTAAKITASGGTILNGPHEVPGGVYVVQFTDPQGALAAVVGPRK